MDARISIIDQRDRIFRIAGELEKPISHDVVVFREREESLPVIRVPIELLLYRMENGRTGKRQKEFIRRNNLPETYFVNGEENEEVQHVQHGILLDLAKDSRGDIHGELQYRAVQVENLLITHAGVVVNGNRRLAAMRDLRASDPLRFKTFGYVNVTVLPGTATPADLEEVESELQEIPETKLEYDWISRRLKMRRRRDQFSIPSDKLKRMYRVKSQKDINREIEQLELAEDYLERYLSRPLDYDAVENSEQIFKQLQAALETKSGEFEELSRCIAFPLIKEARGLQDRVYQFRFAFGVDAEEVLRRIAEEEKLQMSSPPDTINAIEELDPEDPLAGITEEAVSQYAALKPLLLDQQNSKNRAQQIAKITAAIQQEKQEGGRKMMALRNAETANRILHEIDLGGADPATYPSIRAQLTSCMARADELIKKMPLRKEEALKSGA